MIYQLKVTLKGVKPAIWRRVVVRSDLTLLKLHTILQRTMGWMGGHLHQFRADGLTWGTNSFESFGPPVISERRATVEDALSGVGARFTYDYDYGDGWQHTVVVEKVLDPASGQKYPVCLAGQRRCPPEDCGGPPGYDRLLSVLANPSHPEHAEMKAWAGSFFDPEAFDLDAVNRSLRRLK